MKHTLSKLLHSRLVQATGLLTLVAVAAGTVAWTEGPTARVKLGGAWVAVLDTGARGTGMYGATDPSGLKSVYRAQFVHPPAVLAAMGVDSFTDLVAEEVVTGKNTSESIGISYGVAGGQVVAILVDHTWFTHISPNEKHNTHETSIYLASADANNDGFPDADAQPIMVLPASSISKRITR